MEEEIICPYCEYKHENIHEIIDVYDDYNDVTCQSCHKKFGVESIRSVSYLTHKKDYL